MTAQVGVPRRIVDPHPDTARALGELWIAVTEAGGAVDFVPGWDPAEIRGLAAATIDGVRSGALRMLVLGDETAPDGTVFLARGSGIAAHRADVQRLMVRPDLQGRGLGTVLLEAAVAHGREMGVEMLTLGARGGTSLPAFYTARGFVEYGLLPRGVRLGAEDVRDVHLFVFPLTS
ncbi:MULTISPECIES: GNAT family N-acetyltransferase [Pseudonocardia]|uniref:Acetyltransferase n=2 Tax=Pseudonocardia TaxID=1847 RepID=A0A1Y2MY55_PSEAH|nr:MULTISPECIES: GNAT family N-acetyltransferase [Pseudonocardia]OSY40144.1 Acetyltransferase [Pseudonocardia autotrophica]TDN72911.1 acetyltransferase (GNAT) family protein [Pseudonocardia autotrophica]BBG03630.1 hypothetical protein Pdca_48390 [Pseudonocardia autotrophica]GEC26328.1 hypothetical protein PSA01_33570 [Pseudonocardia saturnea]